MFKQRRTEYLKQVAEHSISVFFSGHAPQKSCDQNYPFTVNRNFFYLTGIEQENVTLVLVKGKDLDATYLFLEENDPVKVLWDGAGLTFEEASKIAKLELSEVKNLKTFDSSIHNLLSTNRSALYGQISTFYLDLERQNECSQNAKFLQTLNTAVKSHQKLPGCSQLSQSY